MSLFLKACVTHVQELHFGRFRLVFLCLTPKTTMLDRDGVPTGAHCPKYAVSAIGKCGLPVVCLQPAVMMEGERRRCALQAAHFRSEFLRGWIRLLEARGLLIRALEMIAWPRLAMKTVTEVGLVSVQLETG